MRKAYIIVAILLTLTLSGCTKTVDDDFELVRPADVPVVLNDLDYSGYLKLTNPVITIDVKDIGEIKLQLFPDIAPNTVNSFILYVQNGDFDNNEFHRVIEDFMIQGGKITGACTIPGEMTLRYDENDLLHYRGVISMARVGTLFDSATSQFFIVAEDSHHLNSNYAGFGGVVDGFEVIDYIASLDNGQEAPVVPIVINSITVELNGYVVADRICAE